MPGETSLNNQVAHRDGNYHPTHGVIHKNLTFNDQGDGEIIVGVLPAGAVVTTGTLWVKTAFNGTTPTVSIGVAGTPALYLAATAVTAIGGTALGALLVAAAAVPTGVARNLVAVVAGTGSTVGSADVLLEFTP